MTNNLQKELTRLKTQIFTPPPDLKLSEFADEYRVLSPENCASPGKWNTSNAEYTREIMDTITNPDYEEVCIKSAAQIAKSEILINTLLYYIVNDPCSILMLQPTITNASDFSKERLSPAIRDCKQAAELVSDAKSRDGSNTILTKQFMGGQLAIGGANSPSGLASRPIRVLLLDEISRYPLSAGTEGSPVRLAKQRTANFYNRRIIYVSTPTTEGICQISDIYESSDQRKYNIFCKHCNDYFEPTWKDVLWSKKDKGEHDPSTALLHCSKCGTGLNDSERLYGVSKGKWFKTFPDRKIAGFHLSAICSPWVKLPKLVEEFLTCKDDANLLKTFTNTKLGETWREEGENLDSLDFVSRLEDYTPQTIPEDVIMLTSGTDIQIDRTETVVYGWAHEDHSYVIERKILHGDTSTQQIYNEQLKPYLLSEFKREDGLPLKISASCIDSGYNTQVIYEFCKKNLRNRFYAIKGRSGQGVQLWPKRATKTRLGTVFTLGVDTGKDEIYQKLQLSDINQHGYCHFSLECDDDFFQQLLAEQKLTKFKNGYPYIVWQLRKGIRNEVFDCSVYALAAKYSLSPNLKAVEKRNTRLLEKIKTDKTVEKVVDENIEENIFINRNKQKQKQKTTIRRTTSWLNG